MKDRLGRTLTKDAEKVLNALNSDERAWTLYREATRYRLEDMREYGRKGSYTDDYDWSHSNRATAYSHSLKVVLGYDNDLIPWDFKECPSDVLDTMIDDDVFYRYFHMELGMPVKKLAPLSHMERTILEIKTAEKTREQKED